MLWIYVLISSEKSHRGCCYFTPLLSVRCSSSFSFVFIMLIMTRGLFGFFSYSFFTTLSKRIDYSSFFRSWIHFSILNPAHLSNYDSLCRLIRCIPPLRLYNLVMMSLVCRIVFVPFVLVSSSVAVDVLSCFWETCILQFCHVFFKEFAGYLFLYLRSSLYRELIWSGIVTV